MYYDTLLLEWQDGMNKMIFYNTIIIIIIESKYLITHYYKYMF